MSFRITGLSPAPFVPLYGLSDAALLASARVDYIQAPYAPRGGYAGPLARG